MAAHRTLSSLVVAAIFLGMFLFRAPMGAGQVLMAILGWALAFYGAEMAVLIGAKSSPSTDHLIEPFVRFIGWFFLLLVSGLFVARVMRVL